MTNRPDDQPLSRPLDVDDVPADGLDVTIETTPEERAALARAFDLADLPGLSARFTIKGTAKRLAVKGRVDARVTQTCVVSLDPFDSSVSEDVDVAFAAPRPAGADPTGYNDAQTGDSLQDPPDDIVDGKIDLGALTVEFLALGLDPYPRKPGVEFDPGLGPDAPASPFAALARLKTPGDEH